MNECKILELHSFICFLYQLGVNPPADIASGRIAEVRSRSMSCNCMTRTSQQECRGILELLQDEFHFAVRMLRSVRLT